MSAPESEVFGRSGRAAAGACGQWNARVRDWLRSGRLREQGGPALPELEYADCTPAGDGPCLMHAIHQDIDVAEAEPATSVGDPKRAQALNAHTRVDGQIPGGRGDWLAGPNARTIVGPGVVVPTHVPGDSVQLTGGQRLRLVNRGERDHKCGYRGQNGRPAHG
jgi:hypothetical protein